MPDITPSVLANAIMGKLYDVLTNGDATVPKSEDNFFSWATPGIPVLPEDFAFLRQGFTGVVKPAATQALLAAASASGQAASGGAAAPAALTDAQLAQLRAQDVSGLYQQAEALARMVDFVPDVTSINNTHFSTLSVMNNEGTLSEIYERVLKFSQVMHSELTDDEKAKVAHFRSLLTATTTKTDLITGDSVQVSGPSPLVQAYTEKMGAYDNAALEYNGRRVDALAANDPASVSYFELNANILRDKVRAAMADWVTNGYKNQYEEIAAFIAQVEGRDLVLLKQAYLDDLEKARLTGIASGSDFFYTGLIPASFADSNGWSDFHFRAGDFTSYSKSEYKASGWTASAGGSFLGIFGGAATASGNSSRQAYEGSFNSDSCSMRFQIAQVPIVRPWFKTSYLNSKVWRFDPTNPDVKGDMLSDGGAPPKGLLVSYPTSAIFIRKLALDFGSNSGFSNYLAQQSNSSAGGGGTVSLGPIVLGGGGSSSSSQGSTTRSAGYKFTDQGLTVDGMQLIGFKCHVMPKSPNTASGITSWA